MFHLRTIFSTINKKKTVFFILLILFNILFYACNKENLDHTAEVFKGTINGEAFSPTIDTITKSGESYTLTFSDGNRKIVVVTNNISDGTYVITSNNINSSTEKLATAVYFNAGESYPGQSGTLTLSGADSGNLSGTYSFTSLINTKPVSIEGSFKSVRITEASSADNNPVTESDSAWVTRVDVIGNSSPVLHFTGKSVTRTSNNQLVFIFTVGTDELKIVTNSTESGTYTICLNGLEPSTAKQACLSYIFNGGDPDGYYAVADTGTFNI